MDRYGGWTDSGMIGPSITVRRQRLEGLQKFLIDHHQIIKDALYSDLRKSPQEADLTEIGVVLSEIGCALKNLKNWMRPRRLRLPLSYLPASASLVPEPLGSVLIISPWNYPLQLALAPLVGALAAGNTATIKPSELAPATAEILSLVPHYVPGVSVVLGGVEETTALLTQDFDHIFFTGGGAVGRIVMEAAAKNLTPVTLELGGKSPTWLDSSVNLGAAARRIAWAKFINAGQTCVAPDYLMCPPSMVDDVVAAINNAVHAMWGENPQDSHDYGRIINDRHFERLLALKPDAISDRNDLYVAPTVFAAENTTHDSMSEEIFGPLLPVIGMELAEAIEYVKSGPKPLAIYVFGREAKKHFVEQTSSGAVGSGVALLQAGATGIPFGGIGASGMGAYHGKSSWNTFTHMKPVISKPLFPDTLRMIQPPYSPLKTAIIHMVARIENTWGSLAQRGRES